MIRPDPIEQPEVFLSDRAHVFIDKIISAHGGRDVWNTIAWLEADLSAYGFLFMAKQRPLLHKVRVRASARDPYFQFCDFPEAGKTGELLGDREVRICRTDGSVLENRFHPRAAFQGIRRKLWWDDLDFIYFGGYAIWNYLVTPFIFMRQGFAFEYLGELRMPEGTFSCLRATFPDELPTHCRTQTFYFSESWLLCRVDYTAEVVGGWAHAAHFCDEYRDFSGLMIPTRRRVRPLFSGRVLSRPTLVAIDIHDLKIHLDSPV
jgi:hypothetical protein